MVQRVVAKHMAEHASANRVDFVLTLGDNFYYDGVVNVEDKRFYVGMATGPVWWWCCLGMCAGVYGCVRRCV